MPSATGQNWEKYRKNFADEDEPEKKIIPLTDEYVNIPFSRRIGLDWIGLRLLWLWLLSPRDESVTAGGHCGPDLITYAIRHISFIERDIYKSNLLIIALFTVTSKS